MSTVDLVLPRPRAGRFTRGFDEAALRAPFDEQREAFTVGVEEELMVLDRRTLDLAPRAADVLDALGDDGRFCAELPAAQLEIVSPVCVHTGAIGRALLTARRDAAEAAAPMGLVLAGSGTHPFAPAEGVMSAGPRYAAIVDEYRWAARRAMSWGLHVHVAVPGADRALAVHDALRSYLPWLGAIAVNAPFHAGTDTGLASVRPKLSDGLPRQGIPPAFGTWAAYAQWLAWGARSNAFGASHLWWELRLHPTFGTLELRVCDQPATAARSATLAAVIQALCAWLAARHDDGERLPCDPTERIDENRWRALRDGSSGTLLDLDTGAGRSTSEGLAELLATIRPFATGLGSVGAFDEVDELLCTPGADRQRAAAREAGGLRAVVAAQAEAFDAELAGLGAIGAVAA